MKTYRKSQNSTFLFAMRTTTLVAMLALVLSGGLRVVQADQIPDRGTLNAILGLNKILEDFESFDVGDGDAVILDVALDHTTITNGQGPGLVEPGAVYLFFEKRLQWHGNDYYELETKTIVGGGLEILYTTDVQAMGLDLRAYVGYGDDGTVDVYDTGDVLVSSTDFTLTSGGGENVFFGWQHEEGIGRVVLRNHSYIWSPIIDNHGYGVPEPATVLLLGLGGLALRLLRQNSGQVRSGQALLRKQKS